MVNSPRFRDKTPVAPLNPVTGTGTGKDYRIRVSGCSVFTGTGYKSGALTSANLDLYNQIKIIRRLWRPP